MLFLMLKLHLSRFVFLDLTTNKGECYACPNNFKKAVYMTEEEVDKKAVDYANRKCNELSLKKAEGKEPPFFLTVKEIYKDGFLDGNKDEFIKTYLDKKVADLEMQVLQLKKMIKG